MERKNKSQKAIVLAVDDHLGNLIALEAVLSDDYIVLSAQSGDEAIAILEKRKDIDLILMDIQMPKMDGYQCAQHIKKMQDCHDIPIIFITAIYKEEPFIKKGYEVGGIDYFSKPFDPEILKMKVAIYSSFRQKGNILRERETQIQSSEEVLKASKRLTSLLESMSVGILISDDQGRFCQINEEVARIFKAKDPINHDLYGEAMGWWDSAGKAIKQEGGPLSEALKSSKSTHNLKMSIKCFDGSFKPILASAYPLVDTKGSIVGAVVVIKDVTEPRKIGEDFEQQLAKMISLGVELEHIQHQ
jgi:CheY-like chemotaxis protein